MESKATELLMRNFYAAIEAGHSAAEALRLAKLEVMAGSPWETSPRKGDEAMRRVPAQYGHPYFWAGFIAVHRR